MTKIYILFTIILSLSAKLVAENEDYFFQDITQKYDLTFGPVNTLSEDQNGFIWFGCDNGLYYGNSNTIEKIKLYDDNSTHSQSIEISKIYKDKNETLWVCTHEGLFKHNKGSDTFEHIRLFKPNRRDLESTAIIDIIQIKDDTYILNTNSAAYIYTSGESLLQSFDIKGKRDGDLISHMHSNGKGNYYFGTNDGYLFVMSDLDHEIKLLYKSSKKYISTLCKDGNKYLIGFRNEGIEVISQEGKKIYDINKSEIGKNHIASNDIRDIIKTQEGEIWIATHTGLIVLGYNKQSSWGFDPQSGLPHRSIFSLEEGKDGGIWIGTWAGGVAYYKSGNYKFRTVNIDYDNNPAKNVVSGFTEDEKGNIWVGSDEEGGLRFYNQFTNASVSLPQDENLSKITRIKCLSYINGIVALGTFKNGLYLYDTKAKKRIIPKNSTITTTTDVLNIVANTREIWIAERIRAYHYDISSNQMEPIFNYNGDGRIWHLFLDSSHNLWICTDNGLYLRPKGTNIVRKCFDENNIYGLDRQSIYSICEDKNGDMWIGTKGKGVFVYSLYQETLREAPDYHLAKDADIYSIISDQEQNIWYYANNGLYYYNISENTTKQFSNIDGLPSEHIAPNSAYLSKSGKIFLGSVNSFNIIDPSIIKQNSTAPSVFVSEILINSEPLSKKNSISSNTMNIKEVKELKLNNKQNSLQFKVVTNNFIKPSKNKFKYRLKNYDDAWLEISPMQDIVFTKIPSGYYTLEVMGSNNDMVWSTSPYQLEIRILPPYWRRWYSLLTYFIITLIISYIIIKELRSKLKLQKEISEERYKSQANDLIYAERVKFFTNISHELRTPLSLILSPINNLMAMLTGDEKAQHLLNVLDRNTQRLLRLTNQTLDFRLLEVGKLEPKFAKTDIVQLSTEVYRCFEQQILDKEISFKFTSNFKALDLLIDGDMIEKVIYNLISNSLKYTQSKGHLFLSIEKTVMTDESYQGYIFSGDKFYGDAVEVVLRDTGEGIKAQLLPHIFERFSKGSEEHASSSGIGLHLCKEYSMLNNGNILLTSNEGIGSTFILNLPIQDAEIIENHKSIKKQVITQTIKKETDSIEDKIDEHDRSKHKTVLLAEDNNELRSYLKGFLSTFFRVVTAKDGQQALEILNEVKPDLIITDISMPRVSGLELLDIIKKDDATKHIPVIVLTAFMEKQYQMDSILKGADSFLTKPIEDAILLAQINNVFQRIGSYKVEEVAAKESSEYTNTFIESIEIIIERNLQNQKFTLNDIISELNISKSTLDRKLKQQANQNPSGLIRDVRLKNAIKLMKTNKFNIDEIATYVGFNSSSYFIRSFKAKYGQTPREYREKHKE